MSVNNKMTAIADEIRDLSGVTDMLDLNEMASHVDGANAKIVEQETIIADMNEVLDNLGATNVGGGSSSNTLQTCIVDIVNLMTVPDEVFLISYSTVESGQIMNKTVSMYGYPHQLKSDEQIIVLCGAPICLMNLAGDMTCEATFDGLTSNNYEVNVYENYIAVADQNTKTATITLYTAQPV